MREYNCGAVVDSGKPSASLCSGPNDLTIAHENVYDHPSLEIA